MMRSKKRDLKALEDFSKTLELFKKIKMEKWEKVDESVQAAIHLGSPTEDWIIPPDEEKTEKLLNEDPLYRDLRGKIISQKAKIQEIADFLDINLHHNLDWLNFSSPLIGNAALEESISLVKKLVQMCKKCSYLGLYLKKVFG